MITLILFTATVALTGIGLVVWGWRGRHVDDHPHCASCRFDLFGLNAPRTCPECGHDVTAPGAVIRGLRVVRRGPLATGLALLLALALPLALMLSVEASRTSVYTHAPSALLHWLLDDPVALAELMERVERGNAGASTRDRVHAHLDRSLSWELRVRPEVQKGRSPGGYISLVVWGLHSAHVTVHITQLLINDEPVNLSSGLRRETSQFEIRGWHTGSASMSHFLNP